MKSIVIIISLLFNVVLSASLVGNGLSAEKKCEYKKAMKVYKKACDSGVGSGCNYPADFYASGQSVEQDLTKANKLYAEACKWEDSTGCYNLAFSLANGEGVKQNHKKAAHYYKKACEGSHIISCNNLGDYYSIKDEYKKASKFYTKACKGGTYLLLCKFRKII